MSNYDKEKLREVADKIYEYFANEKNLSLISSLEYELFPNNKNDDIYININKDIANDPDKAAEQLEEFIETLKNDSIKEGFHKYKWAQTENHIGLTNEQADELKNMIQESRVSNKRKFK